MSETVVATPGAVAIIEAPDAYIVEGRPEIRGQLAYSGKEQLYGGHAEEEPGQTIVREVWEELGLELAEEPPLVWSGEVDSQNRHGEAVRRYVSLFHIIIEATVELDMKVPGKIVRIAKTVESVQDHKDKLTPFAFWALHKAVTGEPWEADQTET